jgi:hypothetical protein
MGFEQIGTGDKPIISETQPTAEPGRIWFDTSPDDGIDWYVADETGWKLVAGSPASESDVDVSNSDAVVARVGDD